LFLGEFYGMVKKAGVNHQATGKNMRALFGRIRLRASRSLVRVKEHDVPLTGKV
jgi:hypothetical protein